MTKRFLTACLAVAVVVGSTNAFASRARQQVMGTADPFGALSDGTHGSFYYDDNLNIFFNPSYVNDFKNWVALEKSNAGAAAGQAEGGFVTSLANWNLGFYFNRGGAVNVAPGGATTITNTGNARTAGYTAGTVATGVDIGQIRPIDMVLGTEWNNMKFGFGATYGFVQGRHQNINTAPNADNRIQDLTLRAGAQLYDFDPFFHFKVIGKEKTKVGAATAQFSEETREMKTKSWAAGTKYHYGEWSPFAFVRMDEVDQTVAGQAGSSATPRKTVKLEASTWGIGVGRNTKLGDTMLNYAFSYHKQSLAGTGRNVLPFNLSVEHDLVSWLALRGGLTYNLWDRTDGVTTTNAAGANTTGRMGATIKVGKANFDWTIGGTSTAAAGGAHSVDSSVFDFSNGLFTTASFTYAW